MCVLRKIFIVRYYVEALNADTEKNENIYPLTIVEVQLSDFLSNVCKQVSFLSLMFSL